MNYAVPEVDMFRRTGFMAGIMLAALIFGAAAAGVLYAAPARIGSITERIKKPVRAALDAQGNVYVSETANNLVRIFDKKGKYKKSFSVQSPLGIAVDPSGSIYIGSESKKSIEVYTSNYTYSHSIGAGEISKPNSLVIDSTGKIYAADNLNDVVKVYDPSGSLSSSFGGTGNTGGLFNKPTSVALNEAAGEVYVTDLQLVQTSSGETNGARIQVFDKNGAFKRSFGEFGIGKGQIASPVDIALDRDGKLYVVDSYQGVVHILDPAGGASLGALYDMSKPLATPLGVAIGKNNIVYVTSYSARCVDIYALDGYVTMETSPATLAFAGRQSGSNPASQTVVIANTGSGSLNWTASADQAWITLGQVAGATPAKTSNGLNIGVNIAGLAAGTYAGNSVISSDFGQKDTIAVNLTVLPPPSLSLGSNWLTFSAKKGSSPASQSITVTVENSGSLSWSAGVNKEAAWLGISPASGTKTTQSAVSISSAGLSVGTYTGYITFSAPGAVGHGSKLTVTLTVGSSTSITVSTNLSGAKYTVSGPATYTGTGTSWSKQDAPAGNYTITFDPAAGYQRPLPQTRTLSENGELSFKGDYLSLKDLAAKKVIITTPGTKGSAQVRTFKGADGSQGGLEFIAFEALYGANIAAGDVDGDGVSEIIAGAGPGADNPAMARIFRSDKTMLAEFTPFGSMYGVNVAAGDFDADGISEIIVAQGPGDKITGAVRVYSYDKQTGAMKTTGIDISAHDGYFGAVAAAADTAGDQKPELVTAAGKNATAIRIWSVDTSKGPGKWTAAMTKEISASGSGLALAAGDTDGDARDEVIIGSGADIKIMRASDSSEIKRFTVFNGYTVTSVAAADLDGDGKSEIIAGAGAGEGASSGPEPTVKVLSAGGDLLFSITPYHEAGAGVNAAVGGH